MMMNKFPPSVAAAQRGFTLLEVLVALTLFSLIAMMAYSGLRTGGRTWDANQDRILISEDIRIVQGFLRRYLGETPTRRRIRRWSMESVV